MRIYTRRGDDGTTGMLYGGRVSKDAPVIEATGAVDEAQAALGFARAEARASLGSAGARARAEAHTSLGFAGAEAHGGTAAGSEVERLLIGVERDLYVVMAELTTLPENRGKLTPGSSLVTEAMVVGLEQAIDGLAGRYPPVREFVLPGAGRLSAALDLARTAVRRAERAAVGVTVPGSLVGPYLNRLSDLVWTMARWQEQGEPLRAREWGVASTGQASERRASRGERRASRGEGEQG